MSLMGLEAIHPGPRTTVHDPDHKVYPYLLRGVKVSVGIRSGHRTLRIFRCIMASCI